jgi:DNA-directed RNA polymerase subunit M
MPKKEGVVCSKCGYKKKAKELKFAETKKKEERSFEVVGEEEDKTLPVMKADCHKCGNNEAYYVLQQTRSADEPETKFLKCTKCGHRWRDYS